MKVKIEFLGGNGFSQEMEKQMRFSAAKALTQTAQKAQGAIKAEMQKVFDRPTSYTLNSTRIKPATKDKLEAFVWIKDDAGKGTPAAKYLQPQIVGGSRVLKRFEQALQAKGLMPRGTVAVPGAGADLDAHGNVKRSQIIQVLSQLQAQRTAGYESRASNSKRSKAAVARQGVTYWALSKQYRALKPGIYLRKKMALGTSIKPVFLFVSKAAYKPRLQFVDIVMKTAETELLPAYEQALQAALASAR